MARSDTPLGAAGLPSLRRPAITSPALEQAFDQACLAYCEGRFPEAFRAYTELVTQGHAPSARALASMFLRGEGVGAHPAAGLDLLRQAAEAGDWLAAWNLAAHYWSGADDVPVDREEARRYFRLARDLGCPHSVEEYV